MRLPRIRVRTIAALLIGMAVVAAVFVAVRLVTSRETTSGNPNAPLILITKFETPDGRGDFPVADNWRTGLNAAISSLNLLNVRVQTSDSILNSTADAMTLSDQLNATLVVWGDAQLGRIDAHYVLTPRSCALCETTPVTLIETNTDALSGFVSTSTDDTYAVYFLLSLLTYHSENREAALPFLNNAIRLAPADRAGELNVTTLLLVRSAILREQGKLIEALEDNNRAILLNPNHGYAHVQRAALYDTLQMWENAMSDYNTAVDLASGSDWAYRARAIGYKAQGMYESALNELNRAFELNPANAPNFLWRGVTYYDLGDYANALTDFTEAIRLAPEVADYYPWRAAAYRELGQFDAALADLNESIRLEPLVASHYSDLGDLYFSQERFQEAIDNKSRAILLQPDYARYYTDLGGIYYLRLRDFATAAEVYTQALNVDNQNVTAFFYRGLSNYELRRLDAALADFVQAIRFDPTVANYYVWRGRTEYDLGILDQALADFNEAIRLEPNNASHYSSLGDVYYSQGLFQESIDAKRNAITLEPNNARHYTDLGGIYFFAVNDYESAVTVYSQAISIEAENSVALFYRGRSHFELGRTTEARADIEAAMRLDPANVDYNAWLAENYQAIGLASPNF